MEFNQLEEIKRLGIQYLIQALEHSNILFARSAGDVGQPLTEEWKRSSAVLPSLQEPKGDKPSSPKKGKRAVMNNEGSIDQKPGDTPSGGAPEPVATLYVEGEWEDPFPDFTTLESFSEAIGHCRKCPLGSSRKHLVFGVGDPNASLVLVGEAPGAAEDEKGIPFVGRAGQLLDKILAAIDLKRGEDVYIANILKCRPPNNRDPLPAEVSQCEPHLLKQLQLIRPKLILALGRIAGQTLLNTKTPLGKLRGKVHDYHGVPLMVTFHPAALLRNPNWKRPAWEDVQQMKDLLEKLREDDG